MVFLVESCLRFENCKTLDLNSEELVVGLPSAKKLLNPFHRLKITMNKVRGSGGARAEQEFSILGTTRAGRSSVGYSNASMGSPSEMSPS